MNADRTTARIVGGLFITATAITIVSIILVGSTLDPPEPLVTVPENETSVILAVICELILAISVMGIGFLMFPILKAHGEGLALGYVVLRLAEAMLIILSSLSLLSLLTLGQEVGAGAAGAAGYQPLGALLLALRDWSFIVGTMIFLGLGGLPLYYLLYQSKLVPRWLSLWGLIGAALVLLYGVISLFGPDPAILAAPIALQEMVFAVWLIAKGFNPSRQDAEARRHGARGPAREDVVVTVAHD